MNQNRVMTTDIISVVATGLTIEGCHLPLSCGNGVSLTFRVYDPKKGKKNPLNSVVATGLKKIKDCHLPLSSGNGVSSTSPPVLYLDDPWLFLCFFFNDLLAKGSIRSTNVPPEDIFSAFSYSHQIFKVQNGLSEFCRSLIFVVIAF